MKEKVKEIARAYGKLFKEVVDQIRLRKESPRVPYRLETVSLGGVRAGVNVDKALRISDAIEDEEIAAKVNSR
jgi:hypothetical protein